ncbi:MAG: hypothetical protein LBB64_05520 [Dysgonamonadaceae bacterium]|jgi:hypothetical protein|nr:hypothetical protein [Dysgonamonadaceae bacterium]
MKNFVFTLTLFCVSFLTIQSAKSQDKTSRSVIYAELGGPGLITSINFDSRFKSERLGFGYRIGMGFCFGSFDEPARPSDEYGYNSVLRSYYTIPLGLNYVFGKEDSAHAFEIGAGTTVLTRKVSLFYYEVAKPGYFIGHLNFMYRIMPVDGGFAFRVGLTPIIGTSGDLFPMVGVSFGYAF